VRGRAVTASVLAVCLVGALAALAVSIVHPNVSDEAGYQTWVVAVWSVVYVALGSALIWRRPGLVIPRLILALGVYFALVVPSQTPADPTGFVYRIGVVLFVVFGGLVALLIQIYPTGRPLPGAWRWVTALLLVGTTALVLGYAFGVQPPTHFGPVSLLVSGTFAAYACGLLGSLPSLALRFHRSTGVERAQLKWFLFGVVLAVVCWFSQVPALFWVSALFPAAAIVVAMFRYRLYDIDRLVSRTTSYAVVTGLLLATYFSVIALASHWLPDNSSLVVAAATLTAAAVFRPALRWTQSVVDRRFNRSRYDATHVVEEFGSHLRTEVDTGTVQTNLLAAVQRTLEPEYSAVWLRQVT